MATSPIGQTYSTEELFPSTSTNGQELTTEQLFGSTITPGQTKTTADIFPGLRAETPDLATVQRMRDVEANQYVSPTKPDYSKTIMRSPTPKEAARFAQEQAQETKYKDKPIPVDQLEYGWLEKIIDVPGQAITRAVNGLLFNLPELAQRKLTGETLPEPKSDVGKVAGGLGELGGMIKGPFKLAGKLISFGAPAKTAVGKVVQSIAKKATTLGAASAASEWQGDTVKDVIVNKLKAGASGAATGAVFGAVDFVDMKAFPLTSWILRAGISSATLDAINGQSPWDDRSLMDKAYSYGLNAWFTRNGISPKTYNTLIEESRRMNQQIIKDGLAYRMPETKEEIDYYIKPPEPAEAVYGEGGAVIGTSPETPGMAESRERNLIKPTFRPERVTEMPETAETARPDLVFDIEPKPEGGYRVTIPQEAGKEAQRQAVEAQGLPAERAISVSEPKTKAGGYTPTGETKDRVNVGELNPGDAFRYQPNGPIHHAMARADKAGKRVREIDPAGREAVVVYNTPVIKVERNVAVDTEAKAKPAEATPNTFDMTIEEWLSAQGRKDKDIGKIKKNPQIVSSYEGFIQRATERGDIVSDRARESLATAKAPKKYRPTYGMDLTLEERMEPKPGRAIDKNEAAFRKQGLKRTPKEKAELEAADYYIDRIREGQDRLDTLSPDERSLVERLIDKDEIDSAVKEGEPKAKQRDAEIENIFDEGIEQVAPFTQEMAEAREAEAQAKKQKKIQDALTKKTVEREVKPKPAVSQMTQEQMLQVNSAVDANTTGKNFPRAWIGEDAPTVDANRQALKEYLIEKYKINSVELEKNSLDPTRLEKSVNGLKAFITGGELRTRKVNLEKALTTQIPEVETKEGKLPVDFTAEQARGETGPKGKPPEEPVARESFTEDRADRADSVLREASGGDNRIFEILKSTYLSDSPESYSEIGKRLGISKALVGELHKKGIAALKGQREKYVEFLRNQEEETRAIDEEFVKPEGRVKAGGVLYGQELPKKAGSINLERIGEDYDIKQLLLETSERWGDFEKNRRTGMTFDEISELADAIGKTPEETARVVKQKTKELPEYMLHFRDILAKGATDARDIAVANRDNPSEENMAKFAMAMKRFEYLLGTAEVGASEVGRALASQRILSKAKEFEALKNYKSILKLLGGQAKNEDVMRMLASLDPNDPLAVAKFLRGAMKSSTKDKLFEAWVNALLSNPKTWLRNMLSNLITAPAMPLTRSFAAIADLRRGKEREISLMEAPAMVASIGAGIKDGVRRALFAWNNELTMANVSKLEGMRIGAIPGKVGRAIRTGGRVLMTTDEFFKGALRMADIYSLAARQAFKEKLTGKERSNRMADLIANPTDAMEGHAVGEALYYTFQKELGKYGQAAMRARETFPALKFIVPFIRTPVNIAKFGVEHTPLKLLEIAYKGGFKNLRGTALSNELGKAALGSFTAIAVALSVADGDITGAAPVDPEERAAFFRQGKREYSIKVGNNWYSYGLLEPPGTAIGIVADFFMLMNKASETEKSQIPAKIATSFYKNLTNKTFNTGIVNTLDAIRDPGRFFPKFVKGLAGSIVPAGVAGIATAIDPDLRDARTILDRIKSRIPGVSKTLPQRLDVFGQPMKKAGTFFSRLVSPIDMTPAKEDAVEKELDRLKIYPGTVGDKIRGRKLTQEQQAHYAKYSGELMRSWINELMTDEFYKDAPDEARDKMIRGRINAARAFVRNEMFADIISSEGEQ